MRSGKSRLFFDERDHELLKIVNFVLGRDGPIPHLQSLLHPYLHPRGIKEMAASRGIRIAYAVIHLLDSLEVGHATERLNALRSLQDEVLNAAESHLRKNTARVLLQIMKELVRSRGDTLRQLELAHDFRTAASGRPLIVRKLLRHYHLLEMPEEWNQIAFDDHVHDSSTKGRKSPSHLIMDAWIKGIRRLTVVYYNHVQPEAATELLEAARIMDMTVRIGIEFSARFRNQYVQFIWMPHGFEQTNEFLSFLRQASVEALMNQGREVSEFHQEYVFKILQEFNATHRPEIGRALGIDIAPLDLSNFLAFVGVGQPSILHLAKFIHRSILPLMEARIANLQERYAVAGREERLEMEQLVKEMNDLDSETIVERYLRPASNPAIPNPHVPKDGTDVPALLKLTPAELLGRLKELHPGCRIRLNLSNLTVEDVLELLYTCRGMITHLEIFNLKDDLSGRAPEYSAINELQLAINNDSYLRLKETVQGIIERSSLPAGRIAYLKEIMANTGLLRAYYAKSPLKGHIGSDSAGHSRRLLGMGLVIKETVPRRAQREFKETFNHSRLTIPVKIPAQLRTTFIPTANSHSWMSTLIRFLRMFPGLGKLGYERRKDWQVEDSSLSMQNRGNVIALGGMHVKDGNGLSLLAKEASRRRIPLKYLNSGVVNGLKVMLGFVPAFITFLYTQDWWLLTYFGAFIWFAITGLRNVLQSLLGGAGLRRSPLLKINDLVSWGRVADSLLYTGISVPLLEYLVKTLMLDEWLGINISNNPAALYAVMSFVNGIYIAGHNILRGLPKAAIVGNLFRSILNIPLSIALNSAVGGILSAYGVAGIDHILQKWAAIINKTASDVVAGIIEGAADRFENIRLRSQDYAGKLSQLFSAFTQLELFFPDREVLEMLESPEELMQTVSAEARDLERIMIINALDLLYFYFYQPRARYVLCTILKGMSEEELKIFLRAQSVLHLAPEVCLLFANGIMGRKFKGALSFYLDNSLEYLVEVEELAYKHCRAKKGFVFQNKARLARDNSLLG